MTSSSPGRSWLADPIASAATAGALVGLIEIALLDGFGRPSLTAALLGVFIGAGGLIGLATAVTGALNARLRLRRWPRAVVHALPALIILVPLGRSLFQGAFAATLPGASLAPVVVPVAGVLGIAATIRIAAAMIGPGRSRRQAVVGAALALAAAALLVINRTMFRTGYPDLHLAITIATIALGERAIVLGGPALSLVADGAPPRRGPRALVAIAVAAIAVTSAVWGLGDAADRGLVASRGNDSRHLVRAARAVVDLDGDGVSAILGGGDCDDLDPTRYGGARDVPGNGRDEDCDGADAVAAAPVADEAAVRSLAEWRASPAAAAALARARDLNLLVVSVDALRADQLAAGSPFAALADLRRRARWFARGFAPAAGTDVSLTTFVTGRWNPFQPISVTLFEALAATGRITHAILPREVLRYVPEALLTRGLGSFDRIVTDGAQRDVGDRITAAVTTDKALAFLDRAGAQRFALWVHYFDVHEHAQLDVPADALAAVEPGPWPSGHRYRALLGITDREIGRLLAQLEARGLADRTLVVFFSDHGESLGEDPRLPDRHGLVVYQALTHVPIAFVVPGVGAAGDDDEPVSLVDLAPTIAGLLGAPGLERLDGVDLSPNLLGAPAPLGDHDRVLVLNEQDQWAVVRWPWKLLVRPKDNLTELYDLAADPAERADQAATRPELVRELRACYGQFPAVPMDRTQEGRRWREAQAQPPPPPSPR